MSTQSLRDMFRALRSEAIHHGEGLEVGLPGENESLDIEPTDNGFLIRPVAEPETAVGLKKRDGHLILMVDAPNRHWEEDLPPPHTRLEAIFTVCEKELAGT